MAKEMTQEEREKFFEEPKGMLGKAVSDEQWDRAFGKNGTPLNTNMTLEELIEYASCHGKKIWFSIEGDEIEFVMRDLVG